MKKPLYRSFQIFVFSIILTGCKPERSIDFVRISIKAPSDKTSDIKINIFNMLNLEQSLISEVKLDSIGTCDFEFKLSKPTLADISIGERINRIYLEPGYKLFINVDEKNEVQIKYTGTGSEVNNYLVQVALLQKKIEQAGGKNIFELEQEGFLDRLDSLKSSLADFHQHYIDTVQLPEKLIGLMEKRNAISVLTLRQIYGWNYGTQHNFDIPEKLNVMEEIPFDTTLLNSGMGEYAMMLHMYMNLKFYFPPFVNKTQEEIENLRMEVPAIIDKEIQYNNYPPFMKEFLRAKNIDYWMLTLGLLPGVDTLYSNFKRQCPASAYIAAIEGLYNDWLALSPGSQAPDFKGTTLEGKKFTLSDLKGKVVYVDVWATWCAPCIEEIPYAKKLQKEFEANDNVEFLYVSIDRDKEAWKKFILKDKRWKGLHINQQQEQTDLFWKAYKMSGVPTYILIDQAGNIVDAKAARPSDGKVNDQIKGLLNKKI